MHHVQRVARDLEVFARHGEVELHTTRAIKFNNPPRTVSERRATPRVERRERQRVDRARHEIAERRVDGSVPLEARAAAEPVRDHQAGVVAAARSRSRMPDVLGAVVDDLQVRRGEPRPQARLDLRGDGVQSSSDSGYERKSRS